MDPNSTPGRSPAPDTSPGASRLPAPLAERPRRTLPPVYFLMALIAMLLVHFLLPLTTLLPRRLLFAGILLMAAGSVMNAWAARLFVREGTTIKPFEQSSILVTDGPFRLSRNPMYLGLVLILLGLAVVLRTLGPLVVVPILVWLIQERFIRHEEAALEQTFGPAYAEYKARVRRWL